MGHHELVQGKLVQIDFMQQLVTSNHKPRDTACLCLARRGEGEYHPTQQSMQAANDWPVVCREEAAGYLYELLKQWQVEAIFLDFTLVKVTL